MSVPAPSASINKQSMPHQIVVALPLREDGKIWTGTVTFTASKPREIEVCNQYAYKYGFTYNRRLCSSFS